MEKPSLQYTVASGRQDGTVILTLIGPLVLFNMFQFQEELRRTQAPLVILDLEQTPYMDSAGLGLLVNGYVSAQKQGHRYTLVGVNDRLAALLSTTHLDRVLAIYPTVDAAESALGVAGFGGAREGQYAVRVEGSNT